MRRIETRRSPDDLRTDVFFRQVVENAPVGYCLRDVDGRVMYLNQALIDLLGFADAAEVLGRDAEAFVSDEDVARYRAQRRLMESGSADPYPLLLRGSEGQLVSTLVSPIPVMNPDGKLIAVASFVMDVKQVLACSAECSAVQASKAEKMAALTLREQEVVELIVDGKSVKDVASEIDISEHTVRNHIKSIYRKLGLHSRMDLLRTVLGA